MLFLTAKPWIICSLMIAVPIIGTLMVVLVANLTGISGLISIVTPLLFLAIIITYFGWLWNAGTHLPTDRPSRRLFDIVYLSSLFCAFIVVPTLGVIAKESLASLQDVIRLLNFGGLLYCVHLIRKGFHKRMAEAGLPTAPVFVDFLLIWILPIGIWFIQPKMIRVLKTEREN